MAARIRVSLLAVLSAIGFALSGAVVQAASLQISPLLAEVPATSSNIVTYTLRNTGSKPLGVQIHPYSWEQQNGEDTLEPTEELLVVPKIVSIPPGREQLVRVALRGSRPTHELSYRLHFQELPSQAEDGAALVKTLLRLNVPLFFAAKRSAESYEPALTVSGQDKLEASIHNSGSRYLRITHLALQDQSGQTISEIRGLFYVLPGATRNWTFELAGDGGAAAQAGPYQLLVVSSGQSERHSLTPR